MNQEVQNLQLRLEQQRKESVALRIKIYEEVRRQVGEGEVVVPVSPLLAKKADYTEKEKLYESAILDSYKVRFEDDENDTFGIGIISRIYYNKSDDTIMIQGYTPMVDRDENHVLFETPLETIKNLDAVLSFLQDFIPENLS